MYAHTNVCSLHGGYAKVRIVSPLPPLCGFAGTELRSSGLSSKGLGHCVRYVSVAVIKAENQGNLWERSLWFMVPEGMGSPWQGGMAARQHVEAWPQEKGARGSWLQIQSGSSEQTGNGSRVKLPKLTSNDILPPEPLQTVPPTQDQGFKYLILWGTFSLK